MQKLLPPQLYLAALTTIVFGYFLLNTTTSSMIELLFGVLVAIAGLAICIYHAMLFHRENTNIYTFDKPDKLIQKGLFQVTRNPMYLGFTLSLLGWALAFSSGLGWLALVIFFLAADRWYIPFEERAMHASFGEQYRQYCERTSRWFTLPTRVPAN